MDNCLHYDIIFLHKKQGCRMGNEIKEIQKRPVIVTVICWLMLIGVLIIPGMIYMTMNNPEMAELMEQASALPLEAQYGIMGLGAIVNLWAAIGMLKGKGQARTVYVVYSIVAFMITILASHVKESLIGSVLITAVFIGLLYIPSANKYFASNHA